jgi:hypothetical protein
VYSNILPTDRSAISGASTKQVVVWEYQRASTLGCLKRQFWFAPDWWEPSDELADLFEGSIV